MKNVLFFITLVILLASCSPVPSEQAVAPAEIFTQIPQPLDTPVNIPTMAEVIKSSTQPPNSTATSVSTVTGTPTQAFTPKSTSTPTEDLSFYSIANCIPKNTSIERGTVTQILDGDTIVAQLKDGKLYQVRYIGIDAPESERPFSTEATQANHDLVNSKQVWLIKDESETDAYGRLLRYVIVGDTFVNLKLVAEGWAQAETYPPDVDCEATFLSAQQEAMHAGRGMWAATPTSEPNAPQVVVVTVNKKEEWVEIQNIGASEVDLTGWNLVSERGNQECYLSGLLKAGEALRIWSMAAQGDGFSCGYSSPIWNNSEPDPAVLYNADGVEVSRK